MGNIAGYQSDVIVQGNGGMDINTVDELLVQPEHISPNIYHTPGRNIYTAVNKNLIICKDIMLKKTGGPGKILGWVLSLPIPVLKNRADFPGTLLSLQGERFFYSMDKDGRVRIQGTLIDPNDEIIFNINPYVAEYPFRYVEFGPVVQ